MAPRRGETDQNSQGSGRKRRQPSKDSDEYYKKRERNNVAVKKSRDKARQKQKETNQLVLKLRKEKAELDYKVKLLSKELDLLRGMLISFGSSDKDKDAADLPSQEQSNDILVKEEVEEEEVCEQFVLIDHQYCS